MSIIQPQRRMKALVCKKIDGSGYHHAKQKKLGLERQIIIHYLILGI
jgi:hypothetical protein